MCRLEGGVGVSGRDSNEDGEGLREETLERVKPVFILLISSFTVTSRKGGTESNLELP